MMTDLIFTGKKLMLAVFSAVFLFAMSAGASAEKPQLDPNLPEGVKELISEFVTEDYLSGFIARNDLYEVHYARRLKRYWKQRNVPRHRVIADKKRHFKRWPRTSYRLVEGTLEIYSIVGQENAYAVQFDYDFDAQRRGKTASGRGYTQLLIRVIDGTPVIYREVGDVTERF